MGAGKQAKGRVDRRQRRQAPRRVPERQGYPATNRASPRRVPPTPAEPVPRPASPGDARGEAPCNKITKISPFPLGRGLGDGGRKASKRQGRQATKTVSPPPGARTARLSGDQPGKPPAGCHSGRTSRHRKRRTPQGCRRTTLKTPPAPPADRNREPRPPA